MQIKGLLFCCLVMFISNKLMLLLLSKMHHFLSSRGSPWQKVHSFSHCVKREMLHPFMFFMRKGYQALKQLHLRATLLAEAGLICCQYSLKAHVQSLLVAKLCIGVLGNH